MSALWSRGDFLKSIGMGAAALAAPASLNAAQAKKPNFVIILADDMGYNGTSAYGGFVKTPNLERMAREGMKFTDFHSSGAVCSPTRAGLVTGRYQERAGVPGVVNASPKAAVHYTGLQTNEVTFPKVLKGAGYSSAIMGKWHLGYFKKYNPMHHGFDEFRGYVSGNVDYFSHIDGAGAYDWWNGLEQVVEEGYSTHLITKHAVRFIEENKDRPFCLYVAHEAVHSPFQGPNSQIQRGPLKGKRVGADNLTNEEAFIQMMTEMDTGVGDVLDAVDRCGIDENTFVIFFSDNGHAFNNPGRFTPPFRAKKGSVFEGGHRVPSIARWPGKIKPNVVNDGLFISLDLFPTMVELSGAKTPKGHKFDGVSMADALLKGAAKKERKLFWRGEAMRDGKWKFVDGKSGGLFDLESDLAETTDLSDKFPERAARMKQALEEWKVDVATGATPQPEPPKDAAVSDGGKAAKQGKAIDNTGDFDEVVGCIVDTHKMDYSLKATAAEGFALREYEKAITGRVTLKAKMSQTGKGGARNALLAFGQEADNGKLMKGGALIGQQKYALFQGPFINWQKTKTVPYEHGEGKVFDVAVAIDVPKKTVTMTIDGVEMKSPLPDDIKEIRYIGYAVKQAHSAFSKITVE